MNDSITKMTDIIHGTIYLSEIEKIIISTPLFNRLHYISQASTVYLTYPSNNSKRFDHSIGTMALCGDIFYYSLCNTEKDTITSFFKDCSNEIELIEKEWHETDESPKVHNFLDKFGDTNAIRGIPYLKTYH